MKREDLNGWYVVDESYHKYVKITNKTGVMPDDDFEDSWNKPPYIEVSEKNKHVIVVYGAIYCHAFKNKKDAETFLINYISRTCANEEFCEQYIANVKKCGDSKYQELYKQRDAKEKEMRNMKREDLNGWYVVDTTYQKYVQITSQTCLRGDGEDGWDKSPYINVIEPNKRVTVCYGGNYCQAFKNKKDAETFLIGHILKTCATQEFCAQYIENVKKFGDSKYYDLFNACLPEKRAEYDKQSKWRDKKRNWVDKVEKMSPIMQLHAIYELINPCPK